MKNCALSVDRGLWLLVFVLTLAAPARAGEPPLRVRALGLLEEAAEVLAKLKRWVSDYRTSNDQQPDVVDLRYQRGVPVMPPVGDQGRTNSCVGWATTALKTYQEALDQRWIPDSADKQLSPAFVWHALNGGKNRGTTIPKAMTLLRERGVPTLRSAPFDEKVHRSTPTPEQLGEAKRFRIADFFMVETLDDIKAQLRRGRPVVISAVLEPVFKGGRYTVFTPELRREGLALLRRRTARGKKISHGRHAMLIVGYDDHLRAVLVRNSWGKKWGQNGHAWVSYELLRKIGNKPGGTNFLNYAIAATDVRSRVTRGTDRTLRIQARSGYVGYRNGRPVWSWRFSLAGFPEALRAVAEVTWKFRSLTMVRRKGSATNTSFAVHGIVRVPGPQTVTAHVRYGDGKTATFTHTEELRDPRRRSLALTFQDRYWGRNDAGSPRWHLEARLSGSINDRRDVKSVTYFFPPSFPNREVVVHDNPTNGFVTNARFATPFKLRARAAFSDGKTRDFEVDVAATRPLDDNLHLNVTADIDDGRSLFTYTANVSGPIKQVGDLRAVEYLLPDGKKRAVKAGVKKGFPFSQQSSRPVLLRAHLVFKNGARIELSRQISVH